MTKYYFVAYQAQTENRSTLTTSSCVVRIKNMSLTKIAQRIADEMGYERVAITCLKDLSKDEYKMLAEGGVKCE